MRASSSSSEAVATRVRVRYSKTGKLRFIGAIDIGRFWERALRRADLPIAYSEGFSPHPKVSFTDALPLGYASTGEYAELTFAAPVDLGDAVARLNAAFGEGVSVLDAVAVADGDPKFSKLLQASCWDVDYPPHPGLAPALEKAVAADALPVERERKGETTTVDLRPAIAGLSTDGARVRAVLHHVDHLPGGASGVAVRPTELHLALRTFLPDLAPPALVTRAAQGRPDGQCLVEAITGERYAPLDLTMRQRQPT